MSVIMTDMKTKTKPARKSVRRRAATPTRDTFTVRDLNRQPQVVLSAVRELGRVTISSRGGGNFILSLERPGPLTAARSSEAFVEWRRRLRQRMRSMGFRPPSEADSERITRMIAGDEP